MPAERGEANTCNRGCKHHLLSLQQLCSVICQKLLRACWRSNGCNCKYPSSNKQIFSLSLSLSNPILIVQILLVCRTQWVGQLKCVNEDDAFTHVRGIFSNLNSSSWPVSFRSNLKVISLLSDTVTLNWEPWTVNAKQVEVYWFVCLRTRARVLFQTLTTGSLTYMRYDRQQRFISTQPPERIQLAAFALKAEDLNAAASHQWSVSCGDDFHIEHMDGPMTFKNECYTLTIWRKVCGWRVLVSSNNAPFTGQSWLDVFVYIYCM